MVEYSRYYNLEYSVKENLKNFEYDQALDRVRDFVQYVMNEQYPPGELIGSAKLDRLCERIGAEFYERDFASLEHKDEFVPDDNAVVIVCTGLFKAGGTSPLIGDIVRAQGGRTCTILATNSLGTMSADDLAMSRLGQIDAKIVICTNDTLVDRLTWLIKQINRLEPGRIILLNHHQDSVIIAGVHPFTTKTRVIFYHHADHNLCLGVHMTNARHVDIHNVGYCNCRDRERITDNFYIPMTVDDKGDDFVRRDFMKNGRLTTCSSGSPHKLANFYFYPYYELVVDRLEKRTGRHVHIGPLGDGILNHMTAQMRQRSIDPSRFVHIPWTEDLWGTFIANGIDLFIGSFPIGGARTAIEAMGAGVPLLMHENYLTRFHSSRDIAYPDHFVWQYPHEFVERITEIDQDMLRSHGARSRKYYLQYHATQTMHVEEELDRICAGTATAQPAPLYPHHPDMLDRALHFAYLEDMMVQRDMHLIKAQEAQAAADKAKKSLAKTTTRLLSRSTMRTYRRAKSLMSWRD